ncbi:MAG TPA: hypothetical protein VGH79_02525 [Gaiellaceae bacterium]
MKALRTTLWVISLGVVAAAVWSLIVWVVGKLNGHGFVGVASNVWHWCGRNDALPHWALLLLFCVVAAAMALLLEVARRRWLVSPEAPPPAAEAFLWREAVARLADLFLDYRHRALEEGEPYEQSWLIDYRERRREVMDAYVPVRRPFRKWIGSLDPQDLGEYRDEPQYVYPDYGPDDTADGLVEKLWVPVTFAEAIGFWDGWEQRKLQRLINERIDLIDSFVRWCRDPHPLGSVEFKPDWRTRLRRARRRWWKRIKATLGLDKKKPNPT